MYRALLLGGLCLICPAVQAESVQTAPAPASSLQQRFDAAKALFDSQKYTEALAAYTVLEKDMTSAAKVPVKSLAITRFFKAQSLIWLKRPQDAKTVLETVVDSKGLDAPATAALHFEAQETLAALLSLDLEDAEAASILGRLASIAPDSTAKRRVLLEQSIALQVLDPVEAARLADLAIAETATDTEATKDFRARLLNAKGRALLNAGRIDEARDVLGKAISMRGGLDTRIDRSEFSMRSDAALAALRAGNEGEARRYLANTGAGRTDEVFPKGAEMPSPPCGGGDDLRPDDMAVIEFALNADGKVVSSHPVFASRPGPMGYVFARAVMDWRWSPPAIAKVSPFFLTQTRVEMRCSLASGSRAKLIDFSDTSDWVEEQLKPDSKVPEAIRQKITASSTQLGIGHNDRLSMKARQAAYKAALSSLREAGAPAKAWLPLAVEAGQLISSSSRNAYYRQYAANLAPLLSDKELLAAPKSAHALRLLIAEAKAALRQHAEEKMLLDAVIADASLAEKDPLRIAALLALANVSIAAGDRATAEQAYQKTGLNARQCASLDAAPTLLKSGVSSGDFPDEAKLWGFEGWVVTEYDIDATGSTTGPRTIIAYPPAVFSKAGTEIAKGFKYRPSFRPEGGLGCAASSNSISFRISGL